MDNPIWTPSEQVLSRARLTPYIAWLEQHHGIRITSYEQLWRWSVDNLETFWKSLWEYFEIQSAEPYIHILANDSMPGASWFSGSKLNYASQVFRHVSNENPAILFQNETGEIQEVSWEELQRQAAALAATLKQMGINPGDRVVGYMPNIPQTVIAFLATASIGAIWSLCSPDLGSKGVLSRFQQIGPVALIAVDGYSYSGKRYDRSNTIPKLLAGLPSVKNVIMVSTAPDDPYGENTKLDTAEADQLTWEEAVSNEGSVEPIAVDFDHPLWIVYSSGTTGTPKAIVHSHGGVVLEHLKFLHFHLDLGADDRFMWYSSTAWMMWNLHVGGLLLGTTICVYDGNPGWPDLHRLWQFAKESGTTFFGGGAAFFDACRNAGLSPQDKPGLPSIRAVGSTGSPLSAESYRWIYEHVGSDIYLISTSGGTDFASAFVGGVPILPVYSGEMSCRCLGAAVYAFDDDGNAVTNEVGELVCTQPMPSMPVYFWGDTDGRRYRDSYFDQWPGVWRHGDWILINERGGAIIYGRSDATINRHGIRMGTSELYDAVEALPEVNDSLVVDLELLGRDSYMPLFVVLQSGIQLDEKLQRKIIETVKVSLSPRHIPNDVFEIDEVPRTFSGKKLEIPIRRLLLGQSLDKVINKDIMANPDSIDYFEQFAHRLNNQTGTANS